MASSSSQNNSVFGWDLIIQTVKDELKTKEDILLCFTHVVLINNGFRCIGLGESKVFDGSESKSEALPAGWAEAKAIRYNYQGRLYNLKSTSLNSGIMINILRVDERSTGLVELENSAVAESNIGPLDKMIPKHNVLADLICQQLINKVVVSKKTRDSSSQTPPSAVPPASTSNNGSVYRTPSLPIHPDPSRPARVGEADLNPFGNPIPNLMIPPPAGGGMLYEPPRQPRYPPGPNLGVAPGSLPPGARFDPFRPPEANPNNRPRRWGPDNDELPPPEYDDMFM